MPNVYIGTYKNIPRIVPLKFKKLKKEQRAHSNNNIDGEHTVLYAVYTHAQSQCHMNNGFLILKFEIHEKQPPPEFSHRAEYALNVWTT